MKVLVIEDDANKAATLRECVRTELPGAVIRESRSYQSGLKSVIQEPPDIVILDMAMPTYDVSAFEKGGRPRPFGGRDILVQMARRQIVAPVVVVTQYETFGEGSEQRSLLQLDGQLRREFGGYYRGAVFYHPAESDWREQLGRVLRSAAEEARP